MHRPISQQVVAARVTVHASTVYVEVEETTVDAAQAIERALRAVVVEVGSGCEVRGPFSTEMVTPAMTYGLVRLPTEDLAVADDRLVAARAVARALLREAGYSVSWP